MMCKSYYEGDDQQGRKGERYTKDETKKRRVKRLII